MTITNPRNILTVILIILISLGVFACTAETPTGEIPQPGETTITSPAFTETAVAPSPTPAPELPVAILAYGQGADSWMVDRLQNTVEELATTSSLGLLVQEGLDAETLNPNVRILIGLDLELDSASLAASNPDTVFVLIDQEGLSPSDNLSVIGDPVIDQQRQSFMAGYLAALVSSDYKVAGLIPANHELSELMTDAFVIGVEFFCGVCNPLYPPFQNFPQWERLSTENAVEGFQPVVDTLLVNGVEVLYVQNQLGSPEMLTYLAGQNVKIVGDETPDTIRNNWVGTVAIDPGTTLIDLWPDLLAGTDGVQVPSAIMLRDTEGGLISEGRMRLFEEMADDLEAGLVSPETNP